VLIRPRITTARHADVPEDTRSVRIVLEIEADLVPTDWRRDARRRSVPP
jgi:hypothetical protein